MTEVQAKKPMRGTGREGQQITVGVFSCRVFLDVAEIIVG